jgi:hypothetical protein
MRLAKVGTRAGSFQRAANNPVRLYHSMHKVKVLKNLAASFIIKKPQPAEKSFVISPQKASWSTQQKF